MPDFSIVQGDVLPVLKDTLTYSNGTVAEPESVVFTMRNLAATEPVKLSGVSSVVSKTKGEVQFAPAAADTATPGNYAANWVCQIGGQQMTFPTEGFLWVRVQENLTSGTSALLVGLPEMKEYLNSPANDRAHDDRLIDHLEAARPLIEEHTGPLLPQKYDELYDGGQNIIRLTHAPSYGFGMEPVLRLVGVSEFRGPIEYPLSIIPNPVYGSIYSVELDERSGTIARRTAGGGVIAFFPGRNAVHVVYEAGQKIIPANIRLAVKEAVRVNYQTTQQVGRGRATVADTEEGGPYLGFFLPRRCYELLAPARRFPSIA